MSQTLRVQQKREIGELLTDPFKFIFRNLREITIFLLPYIMLPFIVAFIFLTQFQLDILSDGNDFGSTTDVFKIIITVLGIVIASLHAPLASVCIIKAAKDGDGNHIRYNSLTENFAKLYGRNARWIFSAVLLFGIPSLLLVTLVSTVPILGAILLILYFLVGFFYLFPLFLYSYFSYLLRTDLSLMESFAAGKGIIDNYWGISIGLIFLSGIVSNMLQYMIMIPYLILIMVLSTALDFNTESNIYTASMTIQNAVYGFALCYLLLYSTMVYLLKYYDIQEQELGTNTLDRIAAIGKKDSSYFDNEGSY